MGSDEDSFWEAVDNSPVDVDQRAIQKIKDELRDWREELWEDTGKTDCESQIPTAGGPRFQNPAVAYSQNRRLPEIETGLAPSHSTMAGLSMMAGCVALALGALLGYRCLRRFRKRAPQPEP